MGKPIKETPILFGEDAKLFNQSIKDVKPASDDEKRRIKYQDYSTTLSGTIVLFSKKDPITRIME